ncbi:MAG: hypothetical protein ACRDL5_09200 [Solirubrobacteraceae bacterium]
MGEVCVLLGGCVEVAPVVVELEDCVEVVGPAPALAVAAATPNPDAASTSVITPNDRSPMNQADRGMLGRYQMRRASPASCQRVPPGRRPSGQRWIGVGRLLRTGSGWVQTRGSRAAGVVCADEVGAWLHLCVSNPPSSI